MENLSFFNTNFEGGRNKMGKIKILIVDDEAAEIIKENLEDFSFQEPEAGIPVGVEIETAFSIPEAEDKISRLKMEKKFYDIMVIDMKMGSSDEEGLKIFDMQLSCIKIVLTARPSIENCVKCLKAGAFDYIEKNAVGYDPYEKLKSAMKLGLDERLKKPFDPFMRWLNKNLVEFIEQYSGEYIAVIDEIVVEHYLNSYSLMERVKKKYPFHHPTIATIPQKEDKEFLFLQ
jgi:CheY-like chemotaxis protein